jgi:dolichol-phosphate mannosyltransferase
MQTQKPASLAIVVPIFNEEANLRQLRERISRSCAAIPGVDWHVLYVDDGSNDASLELILEQHREDERFKVIELSRNFGHQSAITAGLAHAQADAVVVMDGDLQDPPELIPELVEAWRQGAEVVVATRRSRSEQGLRRLGFLAFHRVFQWISDFPVRADTGVFALLDARAAAEINRLDEAHRFLPGLQAWIGFDQRTVFYDRLERAAGEPKQTFLHLARYALDAIFSFSYKPLRLMTLTGFCISLLGFALALVFILRRLLGVEIAETGFTTLVTLSLVLGGFQLIALGVTGEYLGRIYDEVKSRPLYIVRRRHGVSGPS